MSWKWKRGKTRSMLETLDCQGDCIVWTAGHSRNGYGMTMMTPGERAKQYLHRVSWEIHNERSIPPGMVVRHKCDNPPCLNPDHLEIGTYSENALDCKAHRGAMRPNAAIYKIDLKRLREEPSCIPEEAKRLGVSERYLREVAKGWWNPGHTVYQTQDAS